MLLPIETVLTRQLNGLIVMVGLNLVLTLAAIGVALLG